MKLSGKIYFTIIMIFLYLPIFFLIFYSFTSAGNITHLKGFTYDHYTTVFLNKRLRVIIVKTIVIALRSAIISTLSGICCAIAIYYMRIKKLKVVLLTLNNILIVSSDVVIASSFLLLFTVIGHV